MESSVTQAGRGGGQHRLRHRRTALDHARRHLHRRHRLQAREERRHRGAGRARQGLDAPAATALRHRSAGRGEVQPRRRAGDHHRGLRRAGAEAQGSDRDRQEADQGRPGGGDGRRRGGARRRRDAGGERDASARAISMRASSRPKTCARHSSTQNLELPGGKVDSGTTELGLRTLGRIQTPKDFEEIIIATQTERGRHRSTRSGSRKWRR